MMDRSLAALSRRRRRRQQQSRCPISSTFAAAAVFFCGLLAGSPLSSSTWPLHPMVADSFAFSSPAPTKMRVPSSREGRYGAASSSAHHATAPIYQSPSQQQDNDGNKVAASLPPSSSSPQEDQGPNSSSRNFVLSPHRQLELLRKVGEMRRIQNVQKEMALKSPALKPPSARELAAACGYSYSGSDEGENDDPVQQLQEALDRGFAAREQLITANMGLVRHVVQAVVGTAKTLGREDLVQEGAIGLARAVDRWDPEIGGKFSTYAYYWIRATVLRGIAQRDELVRVPEHMRLAIGRLEKAAKTMGIAENFFSERRWRDAREAKELAEAAGLTTKQLDQACRVQERRRNTLSFEAWMEQGKDVSSSAMTGSSSSDPPMKASELLDLRGALAKFLRPKELEALSWRYGLTSDHEHERVTASLRKTMSPGGGRQRRTRDYVAEVEESLFGASSSGDDPRASVAVAGGGGVSIPSQGRFGEAMSFAEVGKRMKVSAEYTRQLCSSALDKLRRAAKEGELAEFALQC